MTTGTIVAAFAIFFPQGMVRICFVQCRSRCYFYSNYKIHIDEKTTREKFVECFVYVNVTQQDLIVINETDRVCQREMNDPLPNNIFSCFSNVNFQCCLAFSPFASIPYANVESMPGYKTNVCVFCCTRDPYTLLYTQRRKLIAKMEGTSTEGKFQNYIKESSWDSCIKAFFCPCCTLNDNMKTVAFLSSKSALHRAPIVSSMYRDCTSTNSESCQQFLVISL
jgi:hypothetical protein